MICHMLKQLSDMQNDESYIRALHKVRPVKASIITEEDLRSEKLVWQDNHTMWQTTDDCLYENIEDAVMHQLQVDSEGSR